jgi:hypothetical protein
MLHEYIYHYRKHLNFRGPKTHENKRKPTKIAAENKFDETRQLFTSVPTKIVGSTKFSSVWRLTKITFVFSSVCRRKYDMAHENSPHFRRSRGPTKIAWPTKIYAFHVVYIYIWYTQLYNLKRKHDHNFDLALAVPTNHKI